jgi:F-type H+-transporting ATPase subunit delta
LNKSEPAARCYAEAVLLLAKEKGRLGEAMEELTGVMALFHSDPTAWALFVSPRIDRTEKARMFTAAFKGKVGEEVLGLLVVLIRKGRESLFDNVVDYFDRMKDAQEGRIHVRVTTARGVDAATRAAVEAIVREASGKSPVIEEVKDPALIGGMVVRVGDILVDGSLRTRLRTLGALLAGSPK